MMLKEILNEVITILEKMHVLGDETEAFSQALGALKKVRKILESHNAEEGEKTDDHQDEQRKNV